MIRGVPERTSPPPRRRVGKERLERAVAVGGLLVTGPLFAVIAAAIKLEGLYDPRTRGPVLFTEVRVSRGRVIPLLKFRTLDTAALDSLGTGPTHIKALERTGHVTRVGGVLKDWYLDELPQLINIARGDMFFIGTRPWPMEPYQAELQRGIRRKYEMPAGLIGPVQSRKGHVGDREVEVDLHYWQAFTTLKTWDLLKIDAAIVWDSLQVQLAHEGH